MNGFRAGSKKKHLCGVYLEPSDGVDSADESSVLIVHLRTSKNRVALAIVDTWGFP